MVIPRPTTLDNPFVNLVLQQIYYYPRKDSVTTTGHVIVCVCFDKQKNRGFNSTAIWNLISLFTSPSAQPRVVALADSTPRFDAQL